MLHSLLKLANQFELLSEASINSEFVYHLKSKNFKGQKILSLTELKEKFPKIYAEEIKKYKGREHELKQKIKDLDCDWNEVINFSTLNPIKLFQLEELIGIPTQTIDIFKIPISVFKNSEMVIYTDLTAKSNAKSYEKTSIKTYKETQFIPTKTANYYSNCKDKKEMPLVFAYVPHLIVKLSAVNIKDFEIIKYTEIKNVKL